MTINRDTLFANEIEVDNLLELTNEVIFQLMLEDTFRPKATFRIFVLNREEVFEKRLTIMKRLLDYFSVTYSVNVRFYNGAQFSLEDPYFGNYDRTLIIENSSILYDNNESNKNIA